VDSINNAQTHTMRQILPTTTNLIVKVLMIGGLYYFKSKQYVSLIRLKPMRKM